jgi:PPOX class probable F420-dependent enzyme
VTARLGDDARRLLDGANFGHLATLMPDGAPKVEPVWVWREDDRVLVTTDAKSLKARNVQRDPRVALSVTADEDPYEQHRARDRTGPGPALPLTSP